MSATWHPIEITGAAGDVTVELPPVRAWLDAIIYEEGAVPYAALTTLTVEVMRPTAIYGTEAPFVYAVHETVLNAVTLAGAVTYRPRAAAHASNGSAITGATERYMLPGWRLRITIGAGGAGKTGKFAIIYGY